MSQEKLHRNIFFSYIKLNFYFIKTSFIRLWTNIWAGSCTMMSWSSLPYLHYNYRLLVNILMSLMSVVFFLLDLTHKPKPYYHRLPYTWACVSSEKIWINEVNFSYMNTLSIWKKKKKINSKIVSWQICVRSYIALSVIQYFMKYFFYRKRVWSECAYSSVFYAWEANRSLRMRKYWQHPKHKPIFLCKRRHTP
jgi:hypothetical protein